MDQANWLLLFLTALIPLIIGFIWYHPQVFGAKLANRLDQPAQNIGISGSPLKIGLIYIFSILLSYAILVASVHQLSPFLLFFGEQRMGDSNYAAHDFLKAFMLDYGTRHRTFGHGVLHGVETGVFLSLAMVGITTLLEGRSMRQAWIHIGFWVLCCGLIGGVLCANFTW